MAALRKIESLALPPSIVRATVGGKRPALRWIAPTELMVDATYQRDLSRQSLRLIRQMVERFAWHRMKPPIVVEVGSGFHVIDGQHTAIAAATIGIKEIPIFVVEAEALDERARAFVGHNTDRITVSPIAIWNALRSAGDPDALDVASVCKRSGVRIRVLNQLSACDVGDTMALGRIKSLIKKRGVINARKVLECLVKAHRGPILQEEILAAEHLICELSAVPTELSAVIRIEGDKGLAAARAKASVERAPIWRTLMARWSIRLKREAA